MNIQLGNLNLQIALEYDESTKEVIVKSINSSYETKSSTPLSSTRQINDTESRYFLFSFGKSSEFSGKLPTDQVIKIKFNGKEYTGKVHSTVIGRIDGLSALYRENDLKKDDVIMATYHPSKRELDIKKIK